MTVANLQQPQPMVCLLKSIMVRSMVLLMVILQVEQWALYQSVQQEQNVKLLTLPLDKSLPLQPMLLMGVSCI